MQEFEQVMYSRENRDREMQEEYQQERGLVGRVYGLKQFVHVDGALCVFVLRGDELTVRGGEFELVDQLPYVVLGVVVEEGGLLVEVGVDHRLALVDFDDYVFQVTLVLTLDGLQVGDFEEF